MPSQPTSWRSIVFSFSHLSLGLPSGLVPSTFPIKILYTPLLYPIRATCFAHLIILDLITRTIFGEQYRSLTFPIRNFLHFLVTSSLLGSNILIRTLFSNISQTFLPQCEWPSFTPIQNRYLSLSLLLLLPLSTLVSLSHFAVEFMIFLP
jgi:hypothetical protein